MADLPAKTWTDFLESTPPGQFTDLLDALQAGRYPREGEWRIPAQDIQLHCGNEKCGGPRSYYTDSEIYVKPSKVQDVFLDYRCRNCRQTFKTYALRLGWDGKTSSPVMAMKFGEWPSFGPPIPPRVISLIGPDREMFLRGRRIENQGLGIGAFAYYRRVIENQKTRLITEIGKVAAKLGADPATVARFEKAAAETQFKRAIEEIKGGIPPVLLIDGHNPLQLLHTALSEGLHDLPDDECLQLAESIRVVLTELAERISLALKDEAELKSAVGMLLNRKAAAAKDGATDAISPEV